MYTLVRNTHLAKSIEAAEAAEAEKEELRKFYTDAYKSIMIDFIFATGGTMIATCALMAPDLTMATKIEAYITYTWSIEKYSGIVRKYLALRNGTFDENKDYKIIGGIIKEYCGEGGYLVYNLADIYFSFKGTIQDYSKLTGTISGKELNNFMKGSFGLVDGSYTSYGYLSSKLKD